MRAAMRDVYLCRMANISWRTCVVVKSVVKQIQSNPLTHVPVANPQSAAPSCGCWPFVVARFTWPGLLRIQLPDRLSHGSWLSPHAGCSCTWQRSLSRETNIGITEEIPALNQSWRGRNHSTSNWPYQGHKVPYLVPRTADCLSTLWSNTEHWPYAPGVSALQECREEYYTVDSLNILFDTIPETCIVEFLQEAGFFYVIWCIC